MLKTSFRENWHSEAGQLGYSSRHYFAFQFVEPRHTVPREIDEGYRLGHCDHAWPRERAEPGEAEMMGWRVGASVGAAKPAAVGKRMFDLAHSPAFLIEH